MQQLRVTVLRHAKSRVLNLKKAHNGPAIRSSFSRSIRMYLLAVRLDRGAGLLRARYIQNEMVVGNLCRYVAI